MSRSRTILGLLAAGMVVLNLVAIFDMRGFPYETAGELFFAALFAQLSALCVYVTFANTRFLTKALLPTAAVLAITLLAVHRFGPKGLADAFAIFGCYAVFLMIVLEVVQRVPRFRRVLGLSTAA